MLINLIRTIQGYLKIRITGYSPERFLNLCKHKKIQIWGLESCGNAYEMYMKVSGFRKLKPIIKKTQTKVTIIERFGLPFFFQKYRKRKFFFASCVLAAVLIYFLTFFIWNIEITGNLSITDDVIFEFLESKDIRHGMLKHKVDCNQMVKDIRKNFDEIVWVSVSQDGTELTIEVKENTDTFEVSELDKEPSDIFATKDGIIVNIITRNGVPQVSVGDTVKAGDLLVSGTIDVMNDSGEVTTQKYVTSDADVWAETTYFYEDELSASYQQKEYTGKEYPLWQLKVGNHLFRLGYYKGSETKVEQHTKETQMKVKENFYLPVWFGAIKIKEYNFTEQVYSKEEKTQILTEKFERFCRELEEQNVIILEKNLNITHTAKKSTATGSIKLQEPIGENRKIIDLSSEPMVEYNGL